MCTVGKTTEKAAQDLKDSVNKIENGRLDWIHIKSPLETCSDGRQEMMAYPEAEAMTLAIS